MARILIVDDQRDQCDLLAKLLRWQGHDAVCQYDGIDALAWLGNNPADLMILDVMMPRMDGLEVLRHVRTDSRTRTLPVALYSAKSDPQTRQQAASAGADDYWVKAMTGIDEILRRIDSLLGK